MDKKRFNQYVSIGVYLDGTVLKYYFFQDCDKAPLKTYTSLPELKKDLPSGLENIFDNTPKLFMMGHGRGDSYGLGNRPVEIVDTNLDKIITDFEKALSPQHGEIFVTLEACNTDNRAQAEKATPKQEKTFLERVSETHKKMTFCGTGPWNPNDPQTGYRASGGFPTLNAPVTSIGGGIRTAKLHGLDPYHYYVKLLNPDSAVEIVARTLKLMKMRWIFEKFFETVFTHTVKKIFQKFNADSDD